MRPVPLLVLLVVSCVACAGTPQPAPDATEDVLGARRAVEQPIRDLGTAVVTVADEVTAVRLGVPPDPAERTAAVGTIRERSLPDLVRARTDVSELTLPGEGAGIRSARDALDDATAAAAALGTAATADLDLVERLAQAEVELGELVAAWDVPGSRSTQVERLEGTREAAAALAEELAELPERPPCGALVSRRVTAARAVETASEELRSLVAARRGSEFDARRSQLADDPYGLGTTSIASVDGEDRACVERSSAATAAAGRFQRAVGALVRALNPGTDGPDGSPNTSR